MSKKVTDVFGNTLTYRLCTLEDIDKHFRCVRRVVDPKDREQYKERMIECINKGTAYCMENTNVFLYYSKETKVIAKGLSFSWVGRPVECAALLVAVFAIEDKETNFIKFFLHHKSTLQHFRSLLHAPSLKGQLDYPKEILIHIHELRKTFRLAGII